MSGLSDSQRYESIAARLESSAFDPSEWNRICDELAGLVGATGCVLVPYDTKSYGLLQPRSSSLEAVFQEHIASGWVGRNPRARGFPKSLREGFVTDQDLINPTEMNRHPYYMDLLAPFDLKWYAAISFTVDGKVWAAAIQGSQQRGPFLSGDIDRLMAVREQVAVAARRAALLGHQRVESLEKAYASAERGVAALGWAGNILWLNARAEELLRNTPLSRRGRLVSSDGALDTRLRNLVDGALAYSPGASFAPPGPVSLATGFGRAISIDAMPVPRDFKALLSGISVLVTLHEVATHAVANDALRERFRLTGRQGELAVHLAAGRGVGGAAESMDISVATARQHLKAIFAKTGVRRQAELVALLTHGSL